MMFRGEAGVPLHWTVSNPKPDCKNMLTIKIVPPPQWETFGLYVELAELLKMCTY